MSPEPLIVRTLLNEAGGTLSILNLGATITSLKVPLQKGLQEVVLAHPVLETYRENPNYLGATVGRYCNRIGGARFDLDGRSHDLIANEGANQLHGGLGGFSKRIWRFVEDECDEANLTLQLSSEDGDQGFPGTLQVKVTFNWTRNNCLTITYEARTDKPTIVNLTNHSYFNLGMTSDIREHHLQIHGDAITEVDAELIPTGKVGRVAGTPFDFRSAHALDDLKGDLPAALRATGGYDHNYVLAMERGSLRPAATLHDRANGLSMSVKTTEPGVQLYTGQYLDAPFSGLCLETQNFPDAPNKPDFPSAVLRPGEVYRSTTQLSFKVPH